MHRCSRREFLSQGMCAAAAVGAAGMLTGCPEVAEPPVTHAYGPSRVFAVRGQDLPAMTREALAGLGGIQTFINPGETVFIKPNLMTAGFMSGNVIDRGECTKPEIVMAVAEECLQAGASRVIIGDGGQVDTFSWEDLPTLDGTSNYALEAARLNAAYGNKVELVCLIGESPSWTEICAAYTSLDTIKVSSLAMEADKVISIPVAKTHMMCKVTFSLKNCLGLTYPMGLDLGSIHSRLGMHTASGGIEQCFLDVVKAVKPHLAVIDFSIGLEGNGPVNLGMGFSERVDMRDRLGDWLILASSDLTAADATGTRVMGIDPMDVKHLTMAYNQGLGQISEALIEVAGEPLDSLVVDWEGASLSKKIPASIESYPPYNCAKWAQRHGTV